MKRGFTSPSSNVASSAYTNGHSCEDVVPLSEEPAQISPKEAEEIVGQLWCSGVERLMQSKVLPDASPPRRQRVVVLEFERHPRDLVDALLASSPARSAAEDGVDIQPSWANGAKIFVRGLGPDSCSLPCNKPFCASHVVVREEEEADIHEALKDLPYRLRKLKVSTGRLQTTVPMGTAPFPNDPSLCDISDEGEHEIVDDTGGIIEIRTVNTFIHFAPEIDARSVRTV